MSWGSVVRRKLRRSRRVADGVALLVHRALIRVVLLVSALLRLKVKLIQNLENCAPAHRLMNNAFHADLKRSLVRSLIQVGSHGDNRTLSVRLKFIDTALALNGIMPPVLSCKHTPTDLKPIDFGHADICQHYLEESRATLRLQLALKALNSISAIVKFDWANVLLK